MTPKTVSPFRSHDHQPHTAAEQTAAWGKGVTTRWPAGLLKLLDKLVDARKLKAGNASEYSKGQPRGFYEYNAPEDEALKPILDVRWLRTRNITRSSILHDLVVAAAARVTAKKTSPRILKPKKKKKARKAKKGGKR